MQSRTNPCIFFGQTGNIQGSHWLIHLRISLRIKHHKSTSIPAPPHIISQVYELVDDVNQNPDPEFCDCQGNKI